MLGSADGSLNAENFYEMFNDMLNGIDNSRSASGMTETTRDWHGRGN
jgi:hypothetical protein